MSVDTSISGVESEYTFERAAAPWISAGYPVIPIIKKRRACRGLKASTDRGRVRSWSAKFPGANPGVVLNDLPLVVIDVDGSDGEVALARLLDEAGCVLPATYEETSGREGGRHIFLRLPRVGEFKTQYGGRCGRPRALDVMANGLIVVAGARHQSGRRYASLTPIVPIGELAEIPDSLYRLLVMRGGGVQPAYADGSRADDPRSPRNSARRPVGPEKAGAGSACDEHREVSADVAALLADTRDGRDHRAFRVVTILVHEGWCDECIVTAVLGAPLGRKAREQCPWDPAGWVLHKIDSVIPLVPFDRDAYWVAAHTAGLASAHLRVLDCMVAAASEGTGIVVAGYSKIGLGSAMNQPRPILRWLVSAGWLQVLNPGDRGAHEPTKYRLTIPALVEAGVSHDPEPGAGPAGPGRLTPLPPPLPPSLRYYPSLPTTTLPPDVPCISFMTVVSGHDAFRRVRGSLGQAYPLFALLTDEARDLADLTRWLGGTDRSIRRHVDVLTRAGIAISTPQGLRLAPTGLRAALDESARRAGTMGIRERVYQEIVATASHWQGTSEAWHTEFDNVGSPVWWAYTTRELMVALQRPAADGFRRVVCGEGGRRLEGVVKGILEGYVERYLAMPARFAEARNRTGPSLASWTLADGGERPTPGTTRTSVPMPIPPAGVGRARGTSTTMRSDRAPVEGGGLRTAGQRSGYPVKQCPRD